MGGVSRADDLLDGAQRELREETGLRAQRWERLMDTHISNSITDEFGVVFIAEELTQGEPDFDDTEDLQIRRLPFRHALQMAMDGEITDVLSLAGLMKLARLRPELA